LEYTVSYVLVAYYDAANRLLRTRSTVKSVLISVVTGVKINGGYYVRDILLSERILTRLGRGLTKLLYINVHHQICNKQNLIYEILYLICEISG